MYYLHLAHGEYILILVPSINNYGGCIPCAPLNPLYLILFSAPRSATAAYERLASAITIAEELQLGATRPELPLSPALRHVRFIFYNPVDCSLKVTIVAITDFSIYAWFLTYICCLRIVL